MGRVMDYPVATTVDEGDVILIDGEGGVRTMFIPDLRNVLAVPNIPESPAEDGTYVLKVVVSEGIPTYNWVAEN